MKLSLHCAFAVLALAGALGQNVAPSTPPPAPPAAPALPDDIARIVGASSFTSPTATLRGNPRTPPVGQTATALDAATGAAIAYDPVTEAEYLARENARPPVPSRAPSDGRTIVRDEAQLRAALTAPGEIVVPGITITLSSRITPSARGIWLHGNGLGNSRLVMSGTTTDDRLLHPVGADCTLSDLTLSGGPKRVACVNMDGLSRGADRLTFERIQIEAVSWGIYLSGGPCTNPSDILEDFTFRHSRIVDFDAGGIFLSWELLRPRITDFVISGKGAASTFNCIWIGLGVVDGVIANGVMEKVGRIGLEAFYPHGTMGGPNPALVTKTYPNGAGMSFDNLVTADTGSMGFSFAGCKRGNIGAITARNPHAIGVEFVDEDPARSDYNVSGPITIIGASGLALSVDKIKGGRFGGILIDTVLPMNGFQCGLQVYQSDDVTIDTSTFTNCGPRYILSNQSTRCHYRGNHFVSQKGENWPDAEGGNFAFYGYGGSAYFNGNVLRGNSTNPLRTCVNSCAFTTSPTAKEFLGYNPDWTDPDNYRTR